MMSWSMVSLLGGMLLAALPASAQIRIDTPAGGWRYTPPGAGEFLQEVHYPAASVNTNRSPQSAQIAGRIQGLRKNTATPREPARLVVDGVALPLNVDDDGRFARPWLFGSGSHSIEVRPPAGSSQMAPRRIQFYEAHAGRSPVRLRVVLSWTSDMTDLDLHVISPDGQHVYFADRVAPNGGALDMDVTTGFGPEIYAHPSPPPGLWQIWVNYFGAGEPQDDLTLAQVAIIEHEGSPREKQQLFQVPLRKPGELTLVRSFSIQHAQ